MAGNSIGQFFRVTTFGESHGLALGCIIDGVPPGIALTEADLQHDLDRRRPGTSRYTTADAPDYLNEQGVLICEVGNSMVHLMEQYPEVPFTWLEFENGGDGIFMLTKQQLQDCAELFSSYHK